MLLGLLWVKQTNINIKNSSLKQMLTLGYILALWLGDRKDIRPVKNGCSYTENSSFCVVYAVVLPAAATARTTRSAVCLFADIVPEKCLCFNGRIINNFQCFEFDTV